MVFTLTPLKILATTKDTKSYKYISLYRQDFMKNKNRCVVKVIFSSKNRNKKNIYSVYDQNVWNLKS